ncbi:MAG: septum formation inhibitor Maf [Pyrinomonas sp.]|mgnify:CR=1 FL=1|uniref:Maf family protein n=1 Tax=Pyrinomonas sp. TaxID=2080306 RepID=UPI003319CBCB
MFHSKPLILASASPRRAEILRSVGWPFEVVVADIDEAARRDETPEDYVQRLAREKAARIAAVQPSRFVLGADTTVVVDGELLGKPADACQARAMLRKLSGKWHDVFTGVALVCVERALCAVAYERTRVLFAALSEREIEWYIATGEPMDKAGAYAVQGRAALFIKRIDGDYWNVVGLPLRLVYELARTNGAIAIS